MSSVDVFGISDRTIFIYSWLVCGVLCQVINIFGIITNIFNIICFTKQGFGESVNISLLAMAVSDLGSLVTMIWICISFTPSFMAADLPFDTIAVFYLASATPHWSFTRVTSCITAMITLERVLCITVPLKIKSIITPRRTTVVTISMFVVSFSMTAPVYFVNKLGSAFDPRRNITIVGLVSTKHRERVETISYCINNFFIPFCAFVIIVVCSTILAFKLANQTKWRNETVSNAQVDRVSSRNQKAAKMVVMISILFIICFAPVTIILLTVGFIPEMSINGKYINLSIILGEFGYMLESVNSSMNIFIYYHMSSKYRDTFQELCVMLHRKTDARRNDIFKNVMSATKFN